MKMSDHALGPLLEPGQLAPDFSLDSGAGVTQLSQLRGKTVILLLHSNGWDPSREQLISSCREALPDAVELLDGLAAGGQVAELYGAGERNALVVINPDGVIEWSRATDGTGIAHPEQLTNLLRELKESDGSWSLTRRQFLTGSLLTMATVAVIVAVPSFALGARREEASEEGAGVKVIGPGPVDIELSINGVQHRASVEPRTTLLDLLHERLGLTGTKKGCDHGQCGACTVLIDGRRVNSCLTLAIAQQGREITTIEGLARGESLHPIQAAFLERDAFQCGFCTPGQIVSAAGLLHEPCGTGDSEIRECMSGNICRCGAYDHILLAMKDVLKQPQEGAKA